MKSLLIIILIGCFGLDSVASENVRYYSGIAGIISPFLEYKPKGEVSELQAKDINYYRVTRDDSQRLLSIQFFQENKPSNGAYFYTHQVTYEYLDNKVIRRYWDINGKPMSMWRHYYSGGDIQKEVFTIEGKNRTLFLYDSQGNPVSAGTGSFRFQARDLDSTQFIQTQFKQDGQTNVLTDYFPFEVSKITTDHRGFLHKIIHADSQTGTLVPHLTAGFSQVEFEFNDAGTEMGWWFLNEKGKLSNRSKAIVDSGYAKWTYYMAWHRRDLDLKASFVMQFFDEKNQRVVNENGIYATVYTLDEIGNYTSMEFLDQNNQLLNHPLEGFARWEVLRNQYGLRKEIRYLNASLELVSTGVAIEQFVYDQQRNLVSTIKLDSNGNKIEP